MADYQVYNDYSDRYDMNCPHCDGSGEIFVCDLCDEEIYSEACDCEDYTPQNKQVEDCYRCEGSGVIDSRDMRDDEY